MTVLGCRLARVDAPHQPVLETQRNAAPFSCLSSWPGLSEPRSRLKYDADRVVCPTNLSLCVEQAASDPLGWVVGITANEPCTVSKRVTHLLLGEIPMMRRNSASAFAVPLLVLMFSIGFLDLQHAQAEFLLGTPVNFGPIVKSEANENRPVLSNDGKTLYFHSNRPGGAGNADIWMATRESLHADWNPVQNFSAINTPADELAPFISADARTFLCGDGLVENQPATICQLFRDGDEGPWGPRSASPAPINDAVSNSSAAFLSADGNTLFFHVGILLALGYTVGPRS